MPLDSAVDPMHSGLAPLNRSLAPPPVAQCEPARQNSKIIRNCSRKPGLAGQICTEQGLSHHVRGKTERRARATYPDFGRRRYPTSRATDWHRQVPQIEIRYLYLSSEDLIISSF